MREGSETGDARRLPPAALEIRGRADARQGLQPRRQPLSPLGRVLPCVSGSAARRGERARLRHTMRLGRRRRDAQVRLLRAGQRGVPFFRFVCCIGSGRAAALQLPRERQRREGARERRGALGNSRAAALVQRAPRALSPRRRDAAAGPPRIALSLERTAWRRAPRPGGSPALAAGARGRGRAQLASRLRRAGAGVHAVVPGYLFCFVCCKSPGENHKSFCDFHFP